MNEKKREALCLRAVEHVLEKYENTAYPDLHPGCAEPGYEDVSVLVANWNNVPRKLYDWMERNFEWGKPQLISLQWMDEWMRCSFCSKAVRESPDSYSWLPSYIWVGECDIACEECWTGDECIQEDIIETYANNPSRAVAQGFDDILEEKYGFECVSEDNQSCARYATGWYPGQNDNPQEVYKELKKRFKPVWERTQIIFTLQAKGQFDLNWGVLYRIQEEEEE